VLLASSTTFPSRWLLESAAQTCDRDQRGQAEPPQCIPRPEMACRAIKHAVTSPHDKFDDLLDLDL